MDAARHRPASRADILGRPHGDARQPKIMALWLALLRTIVDLGGVPALGLPELAPTMLVVLAGVNLAWVALAERARRLLRQPARPARRQSRRRRVDGRCGSRDRRALSRGRVPLPRHLVD
jgi:hypothetical protein